jgi:hypothetical protein
MNLYLDSINLNNFLASKPQFASLVAVRAPDLVIEGKYCSVNCYDLSKESSHETEIFFSPKVTPVGRSYSSDTDEEWIANAISFLPNMDFFINFTSFAQAKSWVAYRDRAVVLALCFWTEGEPLFLKKKLEKGQIDQFSYDYALAETKIFKNLCMEFG